MSILDIARATLKEIPMADVLRERLSLAIDQTAGLERKVTELQTEVGRLQAQLEAATVHCDKAREELQRLKNEYSEDVRIHKLVEFRRGKRTGGRWVAFCPKCHMPAAADFSMRNEPITHCTGGRDCGWHIYNKTTLENMIVELG